MYVHVCIHCPIKIKVIIERYLVMPSKALEHLFNTLHYDTQQTVAKW